MANTWKVVDWLATESLRRLLNKLVCGQFANSDFNKEYTRAFAVGETIRIPLPQRFTTTTGLTYQPQTIQRITTTVTVDQVFGVHFEWDSVEKALNVTRPDAALREQVINPAMDAISQSIDSRFAEFAYQHANNIVGVLGTDPSTVTTVAQARQRLIELGGWVTGQERGLLIPPSVNTTMVPSVQSLFNPSSDISRQYREGSIGRLQGFDWYESMSLKTHTAGTWAGAVTVATTSVNGASTLALTCTTGDTFKKGDVIGIASRYPVNPQTRETTTTAVTKTFVVTADATGAASAATVSISPVIYGPGSPYQNVSSFPTAGDVVTLCPGTTSPNGKSGKQGLAINRDAFALVGVDLEIPTACEMSSRKRDPETGISVAFVRMFDPIQRKMVNRFDVLLGFGSLYSDSCCVRVLCA